MARLPYVTSENATVPIRETLGSLPDLGLFAMAAHAEDVFGAWLTYGGALLVATTLDPQLRELAVLQVAASTPSPYEWAQHAAIAAGVGITPDQIEAVRSGRRDDPALGAAGRAVSTAVHELVTTHTLPESCLRDLQAKLGDRAIIELLLIVGHYLAIALLANAVDLDLDDSVGTTVLDLAQQAHTATPHAPSTAPEP